MVKVTKIAVWKINDAYFEDAKSATGAARRTVIQELMAEDGEQGLIWDESELNECIAEWVSSSWDEIERRTKEAMAGT